MAASAPTGLPYVPFVTYAGDNAAGGDSLTTDFNLAYDVCYLFPTSSWPNEADVRALPERRHCLDDRCYSTCLAYGTWCRVRREASPVITNSTNASLTRPPASSTPVSLVASPPSP